jgi:UPF0755 protein
VRRARFVALAVVLAGLAAVEAWRLVAPGPSLTAGSQVVEVPAQSGVIDIARRLADQGVIRSPEGFVALSVLRGSFRSLRAGEYEVPAGAGTLAVLRLVESGRVRRHAVLHPEGGTVAELARALEAAGLLPAAEVLRVASDRAFLDAHDIPAPTAEGYLFPDTYYLVRGLTAEQVLGRMVQRLHQKLTPELRARARERNLSLHELLTLASIVEREAVARVERPVIAAVFWNRLRLGMPLQADPTVQYAVGKERRTLTRADLATDHPYNTYQRAGLPPGPIASPGLDAILAVLDPAPVKYLYFVKKDDQHHHFSETLEEHLRAVRRYRLARDG